MSSHLIQNFWKLPNKNGKVCIIGAGIAGISTANRLLQSGYTNITIYDSNSDLGGVWSAPYPGLHVQNHMKYHQFPEFPFTKYFKNEDDLCSISGSRMNEYIKDYCKHFHILPQYFEFNKCVIEANFVETRKKWLLDICQSSNKNARYSKEFDFVINCTGAYSVRNSEKTDIPNIDKTDSNVTKVLYPNEITEELLDEMVNDPTNRIVVAGGGKTGRDIATYIADARGLAFGACDHTQYRDEDSLYEPVRIIDSKLAYSTPFGPPKRETSFTKFFSHLLGPVSPAFQPFFTKYPNSYEKEPVFSMQNILFNYDKVKYKILRNMYGSIARKMMDDNASDYTPDELKKGAKNMPYFNYFGNLEPVKHEYEKDPNATQRARRKGEDLIYNGSKGYYYENIRNGNLKILGNKKFVGFDSDTGRHVEIKSTGTEGNSGDKTELVENVNYVIIAYGDYSSFPNFSYLKNKSNDFDKLVLSEESKRNDNQYLNATNLCLYRGVINPYLPNMLFNGFALGMDSQVPIYFGSALIAGLMKDSINYGNIPSVDGMLSDIESDISFRKQNNIHFNLYIEPFYYSWLKGMLINLGYNPETTIIGKTNKTIDQLMKSPDNSDWHLVPFVEELEELLQDFEYITYFQNERNLEDIFHSPWGGIGLADFKASLKAWKAMRSSMV